MSTQIFNKTLIIGLGLIGGSFAKACRKYNVSKEIYAYDSNPESLSLAKELDVIDGSISLDENLSSFDFVVLASPLSTYKDIIKAISHRTNGVNCDKLTFIDLGSVKKSNIKTKILPENLRQNFIPCHPIAGSEKVGIEHSIDDLFLGKKFIICPENTNPDSLAKLENAVKQIGAIVEHIDSKRHDEIYALTSHLPQFLSFLTSEFAPKEMTDEFLKTSFRLNNSNPDIWGDIFKLNETNIEKFYMEFFDHLEVFEEDLKNEKFSEILEKASSVNSIVKVENSDFDQSFFEENFSAIFFRAMIVLSYLQVKDLERLQNYTGSGFRDFTSIMAIFNISEQKLSDLLQKNSKKILNLIDNCLQ